MLNAADRSGLMPCISIIIPAYNAASFIAPTLESCLAQTLQEIEIIPVNDCSSDNTQAVLDDYAARYPGKVVPLTHAVNQGPSPARWTGVQAARAPFIMFVDSDDFLDPRACELALAETKKGHDLVVIPMSRLNCHGETTSLMPAALRNTTSDLIRRSLASFSSYMFERSLLLDESLYPSMYFEDAACVPRIFARAKSIGQITEPNMYLYAERPGSIMATFLSGARRMDILRADELLWAHAPEEFRADYAQRIVGRMVAVDRTYAEMCTALTTHVKAMYPVLKPLLKNTPAMTTDRLEQILARPDVPPVPFTVYLNGFAPDAAVQMEQSLRLCPQAEYVLITENTCDTASAPDAVRTALAEGRHEDAARWFAMQLIHAHGGFYAAPGSYILSGADALRYEQMFFSRGTDAASLHFFGGAPGDDRWLQAMDALIAADGTAEEHILALVQQADILMLPPEQTMLPIKRSACCIGLAQADKPVSLDPRVYAALRVRLPELIQSRAEHEALRAAYDETCRQRDRFRAERDEARRERHRLEERLRPYTTMSPAGHMKRALLGLLRKGEDHHA